MEPEGLTETRVTWKRVKKERIEGMRPEWEEMRVRYFGAVRECREPCALYELSLAAPVVPLRKSGTTDAVGER